MGPAGNSVERGRALVFYFAADRLATTSWGNAVMRFGGKITGFGRALPGIGALIALVAWGIAPSAGAPSAGAPSAGAVTTPQKAAPPAVRPAYPTLIYAKAQYESLLSVNDRCPVKGGRLNPRIRPMYINRQPVGFC